MAISSHILKATEKSINLLFLDTNLTTSIVWKSHQGSSFDQDLGLNVDVFIDYSLTAIRTERKRYGLPAPGELGGISGVEINYLIKAEDMPEDHSTRDILQHETNFQIEKITPIANLAFRVEVKGV